MFQRQVCNLHIFEKMLLEFRVDDVRAAFVGAALRLESAQHMLPFWPQVGQLLVLGNIQQLKGSVHVFYVEQCLTHFWTL